PPWEWKTRHPDDQADFNSPTVARPSANRSATSTARRLSSWSSLPQRRRPSAQANRRSFRSLARPRRRWSIGSGSAHASHSASVMAPSARPVGVALVPMSGLRLPVEVRDPPSSRAAGHGHADRPKHEEDTQDPGEEDASEEQRIAAWPLGQVQEPL